MDSVYMTVLGLLSRHFITVAAGWLLSNGIIQQSQVQAFSAACLLFGGILLSMWQKWGKIIMDAHTAQRALQQHADKLGLKVAALAALALLSPLAGGPTHAADMPTKAQAPFVLGYSGSGWYKFVGTFAELNDSTTALGNVNTFGGAIAGGLGYQWANAGGGTFTALQGSCAYHNVGGSNLVGAITSKWSCDAMLKFGGPLGTLLQWLPAGAAFPTLPAIGNAVGGAHPWIGGGGRVQDAEANVVGVTKHNISGEGFLAAGVLQQYCTTATSCLTMDTFFQFKPSQDGFTVLGTSQKLGKGYRAGINFAF